MKVIEELREYVFVVCKGKCIDGNLKPETLKFLGSAFFISKRGDAVTALHVLNNSPLEENELYYVAVMQGKETKAYPVIAAAKFEQADFCLIRTNIENTPYFEMQFEDALIGTDIDAFGYTDHDLYGRGKELRMLKGHTTMPISKGVGEVNIPLPSGMSGGPVMDGAKCLGFVMGNMVSEKILDSSEEISEVYNQIEKITLVESKEVIRYGLFRSFSAFKGIKSPIFENKALDEFIHERNKP